MAAILQRDNSRQCRFMPLFYQNPVIHADDADPDVIRTGDDFWMVASSFINCPAYRFSTHASSIGKSLTILLNACLRRNMTAFSRERGSPSIRFHDGQFWVFYSLPDEGILFPTPGIR
jgi:beta-xylosidase